MKKVLIILLLSFVHSVFSQDIVGKWKTVDDKRNVATSIVEIYKVDSKYYGKIITILNEENIVVCTLCEGKYHNKKLQELVILNDLVKKGNSYEKGEIIDPESGKTYSCTVSLVGTSKLKVRGFIGFSWAGRTQYWYKVSD